jgi:LacI family transcriptional regulator
VGVRHLVELGHRRIAHIAGIEASDTAGRRRAGYLSAMDAAGLDVPARYIEAGDYTYEGGQSAMRRLLRARPRPTAIVVATVAAAIGALAAARDAGVAVPGEVSVVAVHDLPLAAYLQPSLTTVRMPLQELGERAIELLLATGPDEDVAEVVDGDVELVVRGSSGSAPAG